MVERKEVIEMYAQLRGVPVSRVRCVSKSRIITSFVESSSSNGKIPHAPWGGVSAPSSSDYTIILLSTHGLDMLYISNVNFYSDKETTYVRFGWNRFNVNHFKGIFTTELSIYQPRGGNSIVYGQFDYYYLSLMPELS